MNTAKLAAFLKSETESRPAWVHQADGYLYLANQANIFRTTSTERLDMWVPPEQAQTYIMPSRYNSFSIGKQAQVLSSYTSERYNPLAFWQHLRTIFADSAQEELTPSARMIDHGKRGGSFRSFKRPDGEYVWLPGSVTGIFSSDLQELKETFLFWYLPEKHCIHVFERQYQYKRQAGIDMVAFCSIVKLSEWD